MSSINDNDLSDTISLVETDDSSDFELVDYELVVQSPAPSCTQSDTPSDFSDSESPPPSPYLHASTFHFPDPAALFEDVNMGSSSLSTIQPTTQPTAQTPVSEPQPQAFESSQTMLSSYAAASACELGNVEKMGSNYPEGEKTAAPSQPLRTLLMRAPRPVWIVIILATILVGFRSSPVPGYPWSSSKSVATDNVNPDWASKFAAPVANSATGHHSSRASASSLPVSPLALAVSPQPSNVATSRVHQKHHAEQKGGTLQGAKVRASRKMSSVAIQATTSISKSLTVVRRPINSSTVLHRSGRYAATAGQIAFQVNPDLPVLPTQSDSSYLDNATTTSWSFWLSELQSYHQLVLAPAIFAAREQAREAARMAQRYHQQQVLPAFASLREHAINTAQRTAEFTAQYNDEQVRPAFAFVRQQAAQTAQRTAQYHEKVVVPALAQFRVQTIEAAKTTSDGINKAARRFSSEAAETVNQVKEATQVNLQTLGVEEYVGFMMNSFHSFKTSLRALTADVESKQH